MANKYSTPVESTYVSQYVPMPDSVGSAISNYVSTQLAADEKAQETNDIIERIKSEVGATTLSQDNLHLLDYINQANTNLQTMASEPSTVRARNARLLARQLATNVAPLQQRYAAYNQKLGQIDQLGYSPEHRNYAIQELQERYAPLTPELIAERRHLPDTSDLSWAKYYDVGSDVVNLISAMRPNTDPAELAQYGLGHLSKTEIQNFDGERIASIIRNRLSDGHLGAWVDQEAKFRARKDGVSFTVARDAIISENISLAKDMFEREIINRDFTGDGSSSRRGGDHQYSLGVTTNGIALDYVDDPTTYTDAELRNMIDYQQMQDAFVRENPLPAAREALPVDMAEKIRTDPDYRNQVLQAFAIRNTQNPMGSMQGATSNTASNNPMYRMLSEVSNTTGIDQFKLAADYANQISDHLRPVERVAQQRMGEMRDNTTVVHDTVQLLHPRVQESLRGLFSTASANPNEFRLWEQEVGGRARVLDNAERMAGFTPTNMELVTPDRSGNINIRITATRGSGKDAETRSFLMAPNASNTAKFLAPIFLQDAIPGSVEQGLGILLEREGAHPRSGPISVLSSLRRNSELTDVPGLPLKVRKNGDDSFTVVTSNGETESFSKLGDILPALGQAYLIFNSSPSE